MGKISFEVNNNQKITLEQGKHDGGVTVTKTYGKIVSDAGYTISPGDFITMLNWYRCQKDNGNTNLEF